MQQNRGTGTRTPASAAAARRRAQKRREAERRRKRRMMMIAGIALAAVIVIVLVFALNSGKDDVSQQPLDIVPFESTAPESEVTAEPTAEPTAAPTPEPAEPAFPKGIDAVDLRLGSSAIQNRVADSTRAQNRPEPQREGWLPVFRGAKTDEKIIAITVDDCFQADNLRTIIDLALDQGGKLTIFPIGENVKRESVAEHLKYAYSKGFELENHTYTHNNLYQCSAETLAGEVMAQNYTLCELLGVNYQCHFLRPRGGDARNCQRIHTYADQMGYYGIAHWSVSGSDTELSKIMSTLKPGQLYLFHTTDRDTAKLKEFIPYAVSQGYRLVTMNEMYGYPENETGEFVSMTSNDVVPLRDYTEVYITLKKPAYCWLAREMQDRLYQLGYLKKQGDGVYGDGSVKAVAKFQKKAGLEADGVAGPETLELLFSDKAPKA